jgi:hypothetical protein
LERREALLAAVLGVLPGSRKKISPSSGERGLGRGAFALREAC